jgi:Flp pilus assembly protein TadD/predicted Zn-dependent protease with MMP-like domain
MRRIALAAFLGAALLSACGQGRARAVADDAGVAAAPPGEPPKAAVGPTPQTESRPVEPLSLPTADCPARTSSEDPELRQVERLLDQANTSFDDDRLPEAWACADQAADLAPQSVEAHHLRAAALAALGYEGDAQVAYAMALALDPEDPETLRAAADFYVNVKHTKGRDNLLVGLELARRGFARATARRRGNASLRADLALLEAQALNDLGKSDEALERATEAVRLLPSSTAAIHERGVAMFNLSRFDDARGEFIRVLGSTPDDPYAHQLLGRIYEWLGRPGDAEAHFHRAQELAPEEFTSPVVITEGEFRGEIERVLGGLPPDRRARVAPVPIEVADLPARADLEAVDPPFPPTILGLFRGLPHGVEPPPPRGGGKPPPRAIVLYRLNLAHAVKTRAELSEQIQRTLLHEIGHLEGLDEGDLRRRGLD